MRQRAVKQIFDDGSFREFQSLAEAQHITGIKSQGISSVCLQLQSHARGYLWNTLHITSQTYPKSCDM